MGILSFLRQKKEINYTPCNNLEEILKQVKSEGFAVVKICSKIELKEFENKSNELIAKIPTQKINQFLAVGRLDGSEIRINSTNLIQQHIVKNLQYYFNKNNYEIISGIHLLKPIGKKGILNPHQDSSLVDESIYDSFYFWMPISNADKNCGTLELIPKSHLLEIPYRSLNIPWSLENEVAYLWKYMRKIIVPSGYAVVFHSRLIHGSGENKSDKIRIAINSFIKPKKADLLHYYTDKSSDFKEIEVFKITPSFFYEENIMERPKEKYELYKEVKNSNKKYNKSTLNKLFSLHEENNSINY